MLCFRNISDMAHAVFVVEWVHIILCRAYSKRHTSTLFGFVPNFPFVCMRPPHAAARSPLYLLYLPYFSNYKSFAFAGQIEHRISTFRMRLLLEYLLRFMCDCNVCVCVGGLRDVCAQLQTIQHTYDDLCIPDEWCGGQKLMRRLSFAAQLASTFRTDCHGSTSQRGGFEDAFVRHFIQSQLLRCFSSPLKFCFTIYGHTRWKMSKKS